MVNKFCLALITTISLLIISNQPIHAESIIFQDDFESNALESFPVGWEIRRNRQWNNSALQCMNGTQPALWTIKDYQGSKRASISISSPSCVTEIAPINFELPDASNYRFEWDMSFPGSVYRDRNIAFKYNASNQWYGIKFIHPNNFEFQKVNIQEYSTHLGNAYFAEGITANNTYSMKVEVINNFIQYYINDQLVHSVLDQEPILDEGTIALQASIGTLPANTVYFDNIRVTDLSPQPSPTPTPTQTPTPTPAYLDVTHYSQRDPEWANAEYNHATSWSDNGTNMENWACALTSASMILDYHGIDRGPEGQTTNPLNLNQYLIDNNGYTKYGGVIWSYITKYASDAFDAGQTATESSKLEFSYLPYSDQALDEEVNTHQRPAIIKLVTNDQDTPEWDDDWLHFVVAKGKQSNPAAITHINDPWDLTDIKNSLEQSYSQNEYRQIGQFRPSNTNLSYQWIHLYDNHANMLIEHEGLVTGKNSEGTTLNQIPNALYYTDGLIADSNNSPSYNPNTTGTKVLSLEKPSAGIYRIYISRPTSGIVDLDIDLFDTNGNPTKYTNSIFVDQNSPTIITIDYDPSHETQPEPTQEGGYEKIITAIEYSYDQGWITSQQIKNNAIISVKVSQFVYTKNRIAGIKTLKMVEKYLDKILSHPRFPIDQQAYDLIMHQINLTLQSL